MSIRNKLLEEILAKTGQVADAVQSVSGDVVNNADPLNPIIEFQDSDQTENKSAVTGASVSDALESLLTEQNILKQRVHFVALSSDVVPISTSAVTPSFLAGMALDDGSFGVTVDAVTGAARNITSREVAQLTGTISFQPDKSGGGVTVLHLWSERSDDNVTWTQNNQSLRVIEVSNSGETFKTSLSALFNWKPNEYVRFRVYAFSGGAISFNPPTDTVLGGEVVNGSSVAWELVEA